MFWFSTPKKETEQPYVDIESGILPVLSPDDIKRAEHARQQNIAAHQSYPAHVVPMMPPTYPTQQKTTSNASQIKQNSNVSDLPLVEATLVPYSPVIIDCPKSTAPPGSFDTSNPILNSAPLVIKPQSPRAVHVHNKSMNQQRKFLPRIRLHTRYPILLNPCPLCGSKARTIIVTSPSWITWTSVILLLLFFWPLFWIPLVMDCCKRSRHYCSSCSGEVGEIEALSDCCVNHRR